MAAPALINKLFRKNGEGDKKTPSSPPKPLVISNIREKPIAIYFKTTIRLDGVKDGADIKKVYKCLATCIPYFLLHASLNYSGTIPTLIDYLFDHLEPNWRELEKIKQLSGNLLITAEFQGISVSSLSPGSAVLEKANIRKVIELYGGGLRPTLVDISSNLAIDIYNLEDRHKLYDQGYTELLCPTEKTKKLWEDLNKKFLETPAHSINQIIGEYLNIKRRTERVALE